MIFNRDIIDEIKDMKDAEQEMYEHLLKSIAEMDATIYELRAEIAELKAKPEKKIKYTKPYTWKGVPIRGLFTTYKVSRDGQIMNAVTGKLMNSGRIISLSDRGKRHTLRTDKLVYATWVDPKILDAKPATIEHKDGDLTNNAVDNLVWKEAKK